MNKPKRCVLKIQDMALWKKSKAYSEYVNFIQNLNDSVKGVKLLDEYEASDNVLKVIQILDLLDKWIDEIPPIQQAQRFGNKAFRTWMSKLKEDTSIFNHLISDETQKDEISTYFYEAFGNETRIDYGTGHEMAFIMFIMCLFKVDILTQADSKATALKILNSYLNLVRKLQVTYNMEPAGSHGVWSLDDFQFIPFIFGSSQLINQSKIEPRHFIDESNIDKYKDSYLFFGCLKFITTVKKGPFAEHSNQLWNISSVPTWTKVNSGLIKMYQAEVLDKFPVAQHILFGQYIDISAV